jgi:hypothetical protein
LPSSSIIFTVCPINQLAHAFVLGDSIKAQNPDYQFFIGIIDKKSNIPASVQSPYPIIDISEIEIPAFAQMAERYTIDELTADCKPFFVKHFIKTFTKVLYLDCTSFLFNSIDFIFQTLDNQDITIVPQLLNVGIHPDEKLILNTGIYHSGVIAFKQSNETRRFLDWWSNNTQNKGFRDLCKGLNADQLWLEHVPAMFDNVHIEKHQGLNIGYWNLPERVIETTNNQYFIKNQPLISVNFTKIKYWTVYKRSLKNHDYKNIQKLNPNFGLPNPIEKRVQKVISTKIRELNSIFDWIIDRF